MEGLNIVPCKTIGDVYKVLNIGIRNRKVASHKLNARSSRGHVMFTVHIDSLPKKARRKSNISNDGGPESDPATFGRITFVDLAGSERLGDSKSAGVTMKETGHINKSLFNLGKVIAALNKGAVVAGTGKLRGFSIKKKKV